MTFIDILGFALIGSLKSVGQIALIVIPLMIFIEIFKELKLLDKITILADPVTRIIGLSKEANLPIMAGLIFGISYGGGLIINSAKEGRLSYREIYLINLFLVICHSVFEDTLLFAAIGAKWLPILLIRLVLAVIVCHLAARFMPVESYAIINSKS
ncbi:nucleoside recognition domain-containing protein [Thermosyntropha sp.]|uniref:nucleoside recognition domain-containing protein n=1 Tax=Thermosyntropha sp. TaxID=2740820 RepID=UPI0025D32091|nr:nucleoside recognition domain-containing protein [Thermosyntropha sp.]MBO8158759.1 nucleoside recognition protein [Thermosyntropha sp.]